MRALQPHAFMPVARVALGLLLTLGLFVTLGGGFVAVTPVPASVGTKRTPASTMSPTQETDSSTQETDSPTQETNLEAADAKRTTPAAPSVAALDSDTMAAVRAVTGERLPGPMYFDPVYRFVPTQRIFRPRLRELWLEALQQPEIELQVQAADAFRRAHRLGYRELEGVPEKLLELFRAPQSDPIVRRAVAETLVEFDTRAAGEAFALRVPTASLDLAQILEPALANWQHGEMIPIWIKRLQDKRVLPERFGLATEGLVKLEAKAAIPPLSAVVDNARLSVKKRLLAASALGQLAPNQQLARARRLAAEGQSPLVERLMAARLLTTSTNPEAHKLLAELALDADPAVALAALEPLWQIAPALVLARQDALLPTLVSHSGPRVRRIAGDILAAAVREGFADERLPQLLDQLNDPHPDVRIASRENLSEFIAADQHAPTIWERVEQELAEGPSTDLWRAHEQQLLLLGTHNRRDVASLALPYLDDRRGEVSITSAWCLQVLGVAELCEPAFAFCRKVEQDLAEGSIGLVQEQQLSQLFQYFGRQRYQPAEPLLRKFIPKNYKRGLYSRAAAIWALGCLYEDELNPELNEQLAARMNDTGSVVPELPLVRFMACNAIGRTRDERFLVDLRGMLRRNQVRSYEGLQAAWGIARMTGEAIPDPEPEIGFHGIWFVEPIPGPIDLDELKSQQ